MNNQQQMIKEYEKVVQSYENFSNAYEKVKKTIAIDSELVETAFMAIEEHIKALERIFEDKAQMLGWYIFENDCGRKEMKIFIDGKSYKIKNVKNLVKKIFILKEDK